MPDAPAAIFTPASEGGAPAAPAEVFAPAGAGSAPDAPAAVFAPASAGGAPDAPGAVFAPAGAVASAAATGTVTFSAQAEANETITVGERVYVYSPTEPLSATGISHPVMDGFSEVDASGYASSFAAMINSGNGFGDPDPLVSAEAVGTVVTLSAKTTGPGGNTIALATTMAGGSVSGAFLAGGAGAPTPGAIFAPASAGGAPSAPGAVFAPASAGGAPSAPAAVFAPAGAGGAPSAPGAVFAPASAGGAPTAPAVVFDPAGTPVDGGGASSVFTAGLDGGSA